MSKKVLYIHIGWSKTGTSAIQAQLNFQFEQLKSQGILYSKEMQMNDHAHHHFALAFSDIHGYPAKYNVEEVISMIDLEMSENNCNSLLLSTELSPFYFNNELFCEWVKRFDQIKIISTLRRQSELLISLFNQLVKDPQVRYKGSFLQLTISNLPKMNFLQNISKWAKVVGDENIIIINYDDGVVDSFLSLFSLVCEKNSSENMVNPSLPNEILRLIQRETEKTNNPKEYRDIRDSLLSESASFSEKPSKVFLSKGDLDAIDNHFMRQNNILANRFLGESSLFLPKENKAVYEY